MSDNGEKIARICDYKDIENGLLGGFAPLYLFVIEQMRTEKFNELNSLYTALLTHTAKLLKEVYKHFPNLEDLDEQEKIAVTEALSKRIEEEK